MIEQYVHWNEDIGEWQLKCVAYTGNNMRKQTPQTEKDKDKVSIINTGLLIFGVLNILLLLLFLLLLF